MTAFTSDWTTGVLLTADLQCVLVAIAVSALRSGRAADLRLSALLLVLAGKTMPYVFGWRGHAEAPDWLALLPLNAPLAVGPLLFSYSYCRAHARPPARERLHYLPAAIEAGYDCICLLLPADVRHAWKEGGHDHWIKPLLEVAYVVSLVVYAALSYRILIRLDRQIRQERSDEGRYALRLSQAVVGTLLVTAIVYAGIFAWGNFVAEIDVGPYYLWFAAVSILIALDGWRSTSLPTWVPTAQSASPSRREHDWAALGKRWCERITTEGWWREPELTLATVARRLGVNATYLSRALNEGLGCNFNELINGLRAEEIARRLDAADAGDLLTLAFDAGFNSKATFNRAFAAKFGVAPSAYRRRLK